MTHLDVHLVDDVGHLQVAHRGAIGGGCHLCTEQKHLATSAKLGNVASRASQRGQHMSTAGGPGLHAAGQHGDKNKPKRGHWCKASEGRRQASTHNSSTQKLVKTEGCKAPPTLMMSPPRKGWVTPNCCSASARLVPNSISNLHGQENRYIHSFNRSLIYIKLHQHRQQRSRAVRAAAAGAACVQRLAQRWVQAWQ